MTPEKRPTRDEAIAAAALVVSEWAASLTDEEYADLAERASRNPG
ncbi:hypothetical protein OVA14_10595 [Agrococcus sp. SL85]|nr:hypothetical protein [Agrococcus sp. SL85]WAC65766.1 hypothetical protein OVA14_10595 [Agrococcus sp. SL85]